jgi:hypothetical protein
MDGIEEDFDALSRELYAILKAAQRDLGSFRLDIGGLLHIDVSTSPESIRVAMVQDGQGSGATRMVVDQSVLDLHDVAQNMSRAIVKDATLLRYANGMEVTLAPRISGHVSDTHVGRFGTLTELYLGVLHMYDTLNPLFAAKPRFVEVAQGAELRYRRMFDGSKMQLRRGYMDPMDFTVNLHYVPRLALDVPLNDDGT